MTETTDIKVLRDSAECMANLLDNLAGYEPSDIDMDAVELRFEGESGCDTGCDISIVGTAQQSADIIRALLDQLEAERWNVGVLEGVIARKEFDAQQAELAALRGAQEPVALVTDKFIAYLPKQGDGERWPVGTKLYAHPVMPVINLNHIGRITAQISGQRYTYFSAEDVRHYFEEMKCEIVERAASSGDTVYIPHQELPKPVVVRKIGHIDHDGGEYGEYFVELTDSAEIGRAVYVIEEGEAAGIVVKDGE